MPVEQPLFTAQNRGFRYGDGIFETIKFFRGQMLLRRFHFDRLFLGMELLKMNAGNLSEKKLERDIVELCTLNTCTDLARVRLAIYREEEAPVSYVIEAFSLNETANRLNEEGWTIDIFPHVRKSQDAFANLKTANYLPYVLADMYAKEKGLNESLLLNSENNICDASKANIFLFIRDEIYTPALHQGCVSGTMRRFIIDELRRSGVPVHQKALSEEHFFDAQEVFLTNAINGVRWVEVFREKKYSNKFVKEMYHQVFSSIYD